MADNYLEKKMEDYLRGKRAFGATSPASLHAHGTAHNAGKQMFRNNKFCIIACGAEEEGLRLVSELLERGAAVAVFIGSRKMSPQFVNIGARVYRVEEEDMPAMEEKFTSMMRHYFNLRAVCNLSPLLSDDRLRVAIDAYESSLPLPPANPTRLVSGTPETVLHTLSQFVKK